MNVNKLWTRILFALIIASMINAKAIASLDTIGTNGINSSGLTLIDDATPLTGNGINIGQVEEFRPGKPISGGGSDDAAHSNSNVIPTAVTLREGDPVIPNFNTTLGHPTQMAGVIISKDQTDSSIPENGDAPIGVAKNTNLYSSAYITPGIAGYEDAILTTQYIANVADVRAINHSWQKGISASDQLDGNTQLTLGMDWIAKKHNVLNIFAGNEGKTKPVPTDNFNGMTIGASSKVGDIYRQVSTINTFDEDAVGDRSSISLIAPGTDVELASLGDTEVTPIPGGTSIAVPHVTGTVALLQQYGDERILNAGAPQWTPNARRHEVMKSVLMNSADKIKDDGNAMFDGENILPGNLLGMERTVLDQGGFNWLDLPAFDNFPQDSTGGVQFEGGFLPLDEQMGAGHLNAKRALQQFAPGEYDAGGASIPAIGWDYGMTTGTGDIKKYAINQQMTAGSFISVTLAWDREVIFDNGDFDGDNIFDPLDTFEKYTDTEPYADDVISDLDLYLVPSGSFSINDAVALSGSAEGTLEHIFIPIPATGNYEFWVRQFDDDAGPQNYGLAWWHGLAPESTIVGDFDGNGIVDAADLAQWQGDFGLNGDSDADEDGDSDGADFLAWQRIFGTGVSLTAVPEPTAWLLLAIGSLIVPCRSKHHKKFVANNGLVSERLPQLSDVASAKIDLYTIAAIAQNNQ